MKRLLITLLLLLGCCGGSTELDDSSVGDTTNLVVTLDAGYGNTIRIYADMYPAKARARVSGIVKFYVEQGANAVYARNAMAAWSSCGVVAISETSDRADADVVYSTFWPAGVSRAGFGGGRALAVTHSGKGEHKTFVYIPTDAATEYNYFHESGHAILMPHTWAGLMAPIARDVKPEVTAPLCTTLDEQWWMVRSFNWRVQ